MAGAVVVPIPDELEGTEPELALFFHTMVHKLRLNAHKGKWEDMDLEAALNRIVEETEELREAIQHGNHLEIALEAGDVGNFALIAASIAYKGSQDAKG